MLPLLQNTSLKNDVFQSVRNSQENKERKKEAEIEKAYIAFVVGSESLSLNVCRCAMPS